MQKIDNNKNLNKKQLLMKAEGVKDIIKWIEKEIKKEKELLKHEVKMKRNFGCFEDCGEGYRTSVFERKAKISTLISVKISNEKYMRKLRHLANEVDITIH